MSGAQNALSKSVRSGNFYERTKALNGKYFEAIVFFLIRHKSTWVHFHILKLFGGLFRSPEGGVSQYSPARKIINMFTIISNGEDCYAAPSTKLRN